MPLLHYAIAPLRHYYFRKIGSMLVAWSSSTTPWNTVAIFRVKITPTDFTNEAIRPVRVKLHRNQFFPDGAEDPDPALQEDQVQGEPPAVPPRRRRSDRKLMRFITIIFLHRYEWP